MLSVVRKQGLKDPNPVRWNQNLHRAMVFDDLVGNIDPNEGNWLFDQLWELLQDQIAPAASPTAQRCCTT